MIITRLTGGLGNQMFQYAVARQFLKKKNEKVFFDTYLLQEEEEDIEKIIHRPYALGIFNNLRAKVDERKVTDLLRNGGLINKIKRKLFLKTGVIIEQQNMERMELPGNIASKKNLWFSGNFQSERFFKEIREELLFDFTFPEPDSRNAEIKNKIAATPDAVSIHVRRGDYLSGYHRKIHTSVSLDYYDKAVKTLQNKINTAQLNAFVFTDDPEWVKENLPASDKMNVYYVTGNKGMNGWKDMALMTACRHHIIANSSFSWWGAWLSVKTGVTIAPKHWYRPDTYVYDIGDIVPKNWIIADYRL